MSSQESEQVLVLLNELSMLKKLDVENQAPLQSEGDAHGLREKRRQQIAEEIKTLAEQKKNGTDQAK